MNSHYPRATIQVIVSKWSLSDLTKFKDKKSKRVQLEFGEDVRQFESEKNESSSIIKDLERASSDRAVPSRVRSVTETSEGDLPSRRRSLSETASIRSASTSASLNASQRSIAILAAPVSAANSALGPSPASKGVPPPSIGKSPAALKSQVRKITPHAVSLGTPKVAIALYDYDAANEDEMSVREGENLLLLDSTSDPEWWKCMSVMKGKVGRTEGLVPSNYIQLKRRGDDSTASVSSATNGVREDGSRNDKRKDEEERRQRTDDLQRNLDVKRRQEEEGVEKSQESKQKMGLRPPPILPTRPVSTASSPVSSFGASESPHGQTRPTLPSIRSARPSLTPATPISIVPLSASSEKPEEERPSKFITHPT